MSSGSCCSKLCSFLTTVGDYFQHLLLLVLRLYWGYGFQAAGLGKLMDHANTAQFFASIGVPYPDLMVYIVGAVEFIGGWCLILGFASRLVAIPLIITMITALFTAHVHEISMALNDQAKFVVQPPVTYLLVSLVVFAFGPGCFSIDKLLGACGCKGSCSTKDHK